MIQTSFAPGMPPMRRVPATQPAASVQLSAGTSRPPELTGLSPGALAAASPASATPQGLWVVFPADIGRVFDRGRHLFEQLVVVLRDWFSARPVLHTPAPDSMASIPSAGAALIPPLPTGPVVDVAIPQGADAAAEVQRAIDSLGTHGGVVRLPAGTFAFSRPIHLRSNVNVVGVQGRTILMGGQGSVFKASQAANFSLRDLVIDGGTMGLQADHSQNVGVFGCEIRNLKSTDAFGTGTGIMFDAAVTGARLVGNYIHDCGSPGTYAAGMRLSWGSTDAVIADNRIDNVVRNGIAFDNGSTNAYIARNQVLRMRNDPALAIELWKNCSGTIENNQVSSWISLDTSSGTVRNNVIDGAWSPTGKAAYGIELVRGDGVQVLSNTIRNAEVGFSIDKTSNARLDGNLVEGGGTGLQGYGRDRPATGNVLTNNVFRAGSGRGVFLNQNCDAWLFQGNTIEGYDQSGLYLYNSDDATLKGNRIVDNVRVSNEGEAGLYWNSDRQQRLLLEDNQIAGQIHDLSGVPSRFLPRPLPTFPGQG